MIQTYIFTAALSAGFAFGAGWQINNWKHDAHEKQAIEQAAVAQRELHTLEQARSRAALGAQNLARKREAFLRADAAAARTELAGVQSATEAAVTAARATPTACPDRATAIGVVFAQCAGAFAELAEKSDRHVSDLRTQLDTP